MHPLLACWITMTAVLDAQPPSLWGQPDEAWAAWLHSAEAWHDWFDVLRRLPEATR